MKINIITRCTRTSNLLTIKEGVLNAPKGVTVNWHIVFDASGADDGSTGSPATYTSNLNTGIQYKWNGEYWIKSYEGEYSGATWTILLDA